MTAHGDPDSDVAIRVHDKQEAQRVAVASGCADDPLRPISTAWPHLVDRPLPPRLNQARYSFVL